MMIEADVSMGFVVGHEDEIVPIMAHPPTFFSDLSLEDFMDRILEVIIRNKCITVNRLTQKNLVFRHEIKAWRKVSN